MKLPLSWRLRLPRWPGGVAARRIGGILLIIVAMGVPFAWLRSVPRPAAMEAADKAPAWLRDLREIRERELSLRAAPPKDAALGEQERARLAAAYRDLAAKYPNEAAIQRACGDFLLYDEEQDEAFTYWARATKLDPGDADAADSLGNGLLRQGRVSEAVVELRRAIADRPGAARFHFELANVLLLFRRDLTDASLRNADAVFGAAMDEFHEATRLEPKNVDYAKAYADAFYLLPKPDWDGAIAAWQSVLKLMADTNPDYANVHLARVSLRQGHPEAARGYLAALRRPDFADAKMKLLKQADRMEAER